MSTTTPPKLLLTADECAAWIPVSPGTLDRWVKEGLPHTTTSGIRGVGRRLFHPRLVEEWIQARMRQTKRGESDSDEPPKGLRKPKGSKAAGKVDGVWKV